MLNEFQWKREKGSELLSEINDPLIQAHDHLITLPEKPGIYMWKLKPISDWRHQAWAEFLDSLDKRLFSPIAEEKPRKNAPFHSNRLLNLGWEIRGKPLPPTKRKMLDEQQGELDQKKQFFVSFLESLQDHIPALYVGQTNNLRMRTMEHLQGFEGFGKTINDHDELCFEDLDLFYCEIEDEVKDIFTDSSDSIRTTLEWVATMITIAGYTRRAG